MPPHFRDALGPANYKKWLLIDDYLSGIFVENVADGDGYRYKPTIALANLLFSAPIEAINYPSVATHDHGVNIGMLPEKADQLFRPFEAWMIRVDESSLHPQTREPLWRIHFLKRSNEIGPDGAIRWRPPGEGIELNEIMRFTRRRLNSMTEWPLPVGASAAGSVF